MSHSRDHRIDAIENTLTLALKELGDEEIRKGRFWTDKAPFDSVQQTTWLELENDEDGHKLIDLTHRPGGHKEFYFTCAGWRRALQISGRLEEPGFEAMLSRICKTLKDSLKPKNRKEEVYLYLHDVSREAGVSESLLTNVIESRLIDHHFKVQGAEIEEDGMIRVPINFGQRPL